MLVYVEVYVGARVICVCFEFSLAFFSRFLADLLALGAHARMPSNQAFFFVVAVEHRVKEFVFSCRSFWFGGK